MHTIMVISGGILTLIVFIGIARWLGRGNSNAMATAAKIFIPVWLLASAVNMWIGVTYAGYTIAQELPIHIPVFGIPAALAGVAIWYFSRRLRNSADD